MSFPRPHPLSGFGYRGLRIGILGGSFNPAHEGHLHISRIALKQIRLDQIWWLVSPQNPLKPVSGMASFEERFASAERLASHHPRIIVTGIENELGTRFTADTLQVLKRRFARTRFIWMMGADNLLQVPRWQRWKEIFEGMDVAVFRRPPYPAGCGRGLAAQRFAAKRLGTSKAACLGRCPEKHWILLNHPLNAQSATRIREQQGT